jgi:hypothetical protein
MYVTRIKTVQWLSEEDKKSREVENLRQKHFKSQNIGKEEEEGRGN